MNEFCPLADVFAQAEKVRILHDWEEILYPKGDTRFSRILKAWNELLQNARQMPAFGVSSDKLTREEMKEGIWVEFIFEAEQESGGMPFETLLICVKGEFRGFNIVRRTQGKYQGRCYYVDLGEGSMEPFRESLESVVTE